MTLERDLIAVLVAGGPGLIAGGCRGSKTVWYECADALIRLSADGTHWRAAVIDGSLGGSVTRIVRIGSTWVALGWRIMGEMDMRGAAWISTDAERWQPVGTWRGMAPTAIVRLGGRLFAYGVSYPYAGEPSGMIRWSLGGPVDLGGGMSIEAADWGAGRPVDVPGSFLFRDIVATSRGLVAFGGFGGVSPVAADDSIIAVSTDGLTWRWAPPAGAGFADATIVAVGERFGELVAIGSARDAAGVRWIRTWHSTDGLTWRATDDASGPMNGWPAGGTISDGPLRLRGMAGEGENQRSATWESSDGDRWSLLPAGVDLPDVATWPPTEPVGLTGGRVAIQADASNDRMRSNVYVQGTIPPAPTIVLPSPTGVTATEEGPSTGGSSWVVHLAWKPVAGATGYRIRRLDTGAGPDYGKCLVPNSVTIAELGPQATSADVTAGGSTGAGVTCLWVLAANAAGESEPVLAWSKPT